MANLFQKTKAFFYFIYLIFIDPCLKSILKKFKRPTTFDFSKDIVLITGAAQGLGKELAQQFSEHGATVVLWDINETKLRQTCSEITAQGRKAFSYVVNVAKREQVYETAEQVREDVGNVSILVNNAGILKGKAILESTDDEIEQTVQVNQLSHFWTVRAFLPWMLEQNYGRILEIASIAPLLPVIKLTSYCSSKGGIIGFSHALYTDLKAARKDGISVTCLCPFGFQSELSRSLELKDTGRMKKPENTHMSADALPKTVAKDAIEAMVERELLITSPRSRFAYYLASIRMYLPTAVCDMIYDNFWEEKPHMDLFTGCGVKQSKP